MLGPTVTSVREKLYEAEKSDEIVIFIEAEVLSEEHS